MDLDCVWSKANSFAFRKNKQDKAQGRQLQICYSELKIYRKFKFVMGTNQSNSRIYIEMTIKMGKIQLQNWKFVKPINTQIVPMSKILTLSSKNRLFHCFC